MIFYLLKKLCDFFNLSMSRCDEQFSARIYMNNWLPTYRFNSCDELIE